MVLVLLAAVVLTLATGDLADTAVIAAVVVVNTVLAVRQEVTAVAPVGWAGAGGPGSRHTCWCACCAASHAECAPARLGPGVPGHGRQAYKVDTAHQGDPPMSVPEFRASSPWLAFTGLLPVVIMVPILLVHAYALGVVVAAAGCLAVVGYHLARGQGITSLDLLALAFATVNLCLYFFAHSTWLIEHVAVVFYTLLAAQCLVSLLRGDPWTAQFTRRVVSPEFVADPRFRAMNVRATAVWAAAFAACVVLTVALRGAVSIWLPLVVMVMAVVASRVMGRRVVSGGAGHGTAAG